MVVIISSFIPPFTVPTDYAATLTFALLNIYFTGLPTTLEQFLLCGWLSSSNPREPRPRPKNGLL